MDHTTEDRHRSRRRKATLDQSQETGKSMIPEKEKAGEQRKRPDGMCGVRRGMGVLLLFCAVALCAMPFVVRSVWGKVYIDIDSPAFQKIPIAVADFAPLNGNQGHADLSSWFPGAVRKTLDLTGYFNILNRAGGQRDQSQTGAVQAQAAYGEWRSLGAEYLIQGGFSSRGTQLVAEFRLIDIVQGRQLMGKQYTGGFEDRRDMVIRFVQEVLSLLTGGEGFFDTRIAFVVRQGRSSSLHTVGFGSQIDGRDLARVAGSPSLILSPRWSPDGRYLAFSSYRDGKPDIFVVSPSGSGLKKIVSFQGLNLPGAWSPDGRSLLLTLSKDGNEEIYVMDVRSGQVRRLTRNSAIDVSPVWSPDGRRIAFVSNISGSPQIYVMNADGGDVRRLTYSGNYNTTPAWSPRGGKIAYEGKVGSGYQIFSIDEDGGNVRQLTSGAGDHEFPSWSPDGRFLTFSLRSGGRSRINILNANTLEVRTLYESTDRCLGPAWSPRLKQALR